MSDPFDDDLDYVVNKNRELYEGLAMGDPPPEHLVRMTADDMPTPTREELDALLAARNEPIDYTGIPPMAGNGERLRRDAEGDIVKGEAGS